MGQVENWGGEVVKTNRPLSSMETVLISAEEVNRWSLPPFQRPLRVNDKVRALAADIVNNGGVITGVLTIGELQKSKWIVDGQHRIEAFRISGLPEALADVRTVYFSNMAEMANEFVRLNSALVRMRPDDILRGLEPNIPVLRRIREKCPFVGYDYIRRSGSTSPVVGMSQLIRAWMGSAAETPPNNGGGMPVAQMAVAFSEADCDALTEFLNIAYVAWGRDPEYYRLWGALNITVCMWLWRRLVMDTERISKRYAVLTPEQFKRCLMSLSANSGYLDWLPGRLMSERERSPCYVRVKQTFASRLTLEQDGKKPILPQPAWASG